MKKLFSLLLVAVLCFSMMSVSYAAHPKELDGVIGTWAVDDETMYIIINIKENYTVDWIMILKQFVSQGKDMGHVMTTGSWSYKKNKDDSLTLSIKSNKSVTTVVGNYKIYWDAQTHKFTYKNGSLYSGNQKKYRMTKLDYVADFQLQ